jgi:hypothetical protein
MKALVLGIGLQGKAVVHDLDKSSLITEIVAADTELAEVERYLMRSDVKKAKAAVFDASDEDQLKRIISETNNLPQNSQRKKISNYLCVLRGEILSGSASDFMKFHMKEEIMQRLNGNSGSNGVGREVPG